MAHDQDHDLCSTISHSECDDPECTGRDARTDHHGLMSKTDKIKLDAIAAAAEVNILKKVFMDTYAGNDADDREIDLGDDYDEIHIRLMGDNSLAENHAVEAYAFRDTFGVYFYTTTGDHVRHYTGTDTVNTFQGKMAGADANKVLLGAVGTNAAGFNLSGENYHVIATIYSSVETF